MCGNRRLSAVRIRSAPCGLIQQACMPQRMEPATSVVRSSPDVQNLPQRQRQPLGCEMIHIGKRLRAPVRTGAQHEAEVVAQAKKAPAGHYRW